jgi:hypothetical protein
MQSKTWPFGRLKIERLPGEKYPEAVARTIEGLPEDERAKLRKLTEWAHQYEKADELYK